jgi:cyclophilin family peptidyl-prolyl cis-trans isomerase
MSKHRFFLTLLSGLSLFGLVFMQFLLVSSANGVDSPQADGLKAADKDLVIVQTNMGTMTMRLYPKAAPKMVAQFKKLVEQGFYNGLKFHRVIPNFMIQGGDFNSKFPDKSQWGMGRSNEVTVPAEFHAELHHAPGIIAAARTSDPNSASTQFYVCVGAPRWLDGQYTIFGELNDASSLEVAKKISEVKRDSGDRPEVDVVMEKVYIKPPGAGAGKPSSSMTKTAPKTPQQKQ